MNTQPIATDVEALLASTMVNVHESRAVTECLVLHTPTLDALVDRIGRELAPYDSAEPPHPGSHVIVATEFYPAGGHGQLARQVEQQTRATVICTDLHQRYEQRLPSVVPIGDKFIALKERSLVDRVRALRTLLLALRPENVWLLAHHHDVVAYAAVHSLFPARKLFIHHTDHNVSLGASRRDMVHVDLDFPTTGSIAAFCRSVGKVLPIVVPMSGSMDIGQTVDVARAAAKLAAVSQRKTFSCVTAGTPNKFRFDDHAIALPRVLDRVFASGAVHRHLHIGELPPAALSALRASAATHGVAFAHLEVSTRFAADLLADDADLFLSSFPIGGGGAVIAALACGLVPLWYGRPDSGEDRRAWSFGTIRPEVPHWDSADDLVAALRRPQDLFAGIDTLQRLASEAFDASTRFAELVLDAAANPRKPAVEAIAPLQRAAFHAARRAHRDSYRSILRAARVPRASATSIDGPLRWLQFGEPADAPTAVVLHLHYPELWPEFAALLARLPGRVALYVSLTDHALDALQAIRRDAPHAAIAHTANAGRDIGPRLALMRRVRQCASHRQVLFIHGKKSPHLQELRGRIAIPFLTHADGDRWRRELLSALVDHAVDVLAAFDTQPTLGLVGPRGFQLSQQGDPNLPQVLMLSARMGLPPEAAAPSYFAGSMFWCRPQALDPLLALALNFEVEAGQTDGTMAHVVERSFVQSALRAGYGSAETPPTNPHPTAAAAAPAPTVLPWLLEHRTLPAERSWADEALRDHAPAWPLVALALPGQGTDAVTETAASVEAQWHAGLLLQCPRGETGEQTLRQINHALVSCSADWVGLIDAGDRLAPDALFRVALAARQHADWQIIYTDEDSLAPDGQHVNAHCKPDFNLDYLRSLPYVGGLLLIRRDLFELLDGFDPLAEGAEDYDLLLRAWEQLQANGIGEKAIGHVAEVLYHRAHGSGHTHKSVPEILAAGQAALEAHFRRLGIDAKVQPGPFPPAFRVSWPLPADRPLVSIVVPTRNQFGFLQRCVESVIEKTQYPAYEIIIIDNASDDDEACRYLDAIESREAELGSRLRVLRQPGPFNFSAMNNAAARIARGDYLLLLNNDTAALHDNWLDEMMGHAVRPDVGIVGAKLLFPDGKVQHAGVILGMRGPAEHPFINRAPEDRGYFGRAQLVQDLSAVTGACLLVRKSVYEQVGGLDEGDFKVSYNDIDLCLKVREAGLRVVFTPFALLLHEGSASQRGKVETAPDEAKLKRFAAEKDTMYRKWLPQMAFDPAYNRHLSLATTEFLLDDQPCLAWDPQWRPRPRILVHPADREGCGEYRIIAPMRALNRAGLSQGWETMRLFEPPEMRRMDPDVLVVQRQMEWPQIDAIERHARTTRAFRVFEIDDLITNLPVKSVHKKQMHKDITKRFRKAAGLCHRLVVATEPLAQAYAGYADEVVVCPNHIEAARWAHLQPARSERAKPRVGWAGGIGHTGDLELIVDVVRETASEVDWVFLGMCPDALKPLVKEFHPGVVLDQYPAKLASLDLDLAVAPLEANAFNEAKSHLRLLEYGILGYPVICSDLTPYQGDFPVTRVANRFRDWVRAIRDAIGDRERLRAQGDALRDKVRAEWIMEDHLERWLKAWLP
jgi:GT2 family glycosyltransferase